MCLLSSWQCWRHSLRAGEGLSIRLHPPLSLTWTRRQSWTFTRCINTWAMNNKKENSIRSRTWSILLRLLKMRGLAVYCYIVYWHYENCCYFIQELFCVGTDLSQKVLTRLEEGSTNTEEVGLMVAASKGTPSRP